MHTERTNNFQKTLILAFEVIVQLLVNTFYIAQFFHFKSTVIHQVGSQAHQYIVLGLEADQPEVAEHSSDYCTQIDQCQCVYWVWLII